MRRNFERFGNLATAKHNDVMLRLLNQSAIVKNLRRHFVVRAEMFLQRLQTYFDPFPLEDICKATLRQTTMQRHLAAFETSLGRIAGARLLSFFTATRGLAEAGSGPSPDALLLMRRAFR